MNYTVTVYKDKVAIETHWATSHLEARVTRFVLQKKYDDQQARVTRFVLQKKYDDQQVKIEIEEV